MVMIKLDVKYISVPSLCQRPVVAIQASEWPTRACPAPWQRPLIDAELMPVVRPLRRPVCPGLVSRAPGEASVRVCMADGLSSDLTEREPCRHRTPRTRYRQHRDLTAVPARDRYSHVNNCFRRRNSSPTVKRQRCLIEPSFMDFLSR